MNGSEYNSLPYNNNPQVKIEQKQRFKIPVTLETKVEPIQAEAKNAFILVFSAVGPAKQVFGSNL